MQTFVPTIAIAFATLLLTIALSAHAADSTAGYGIEVKVSKTVDGKTSIINDATMVVRNGIEGESKVGRDVDVSYAASEQTPPTVWDGVKATVTPTALPDKRIQANYTISISEIESMKQVHEIQLPSVVMTELNGSAYFEIGKPVAFTRGPYTVTITITPREWDYLGLIR